MRWEAFVAACPEIADHALRRFGEDELCMVGTLRADGSPRITPCELDFAVGELLLGMMWQSRKAHDLLRDPRCVLHSCTSDRLATQGDVKLYGRAKDVQDPALRAAYLSAVKARIDWAPEEPRFHVFALDVTSAGYIDFKEPRIVVTWDVERGTRELRFPQAE